MLLEIIENSGKPTYGMQASRSLALLEAGIDHWWTGQRYRTRRSQLDRHFRISKLPNPNASNFGPESGSFMRLLSPKIFFTIIRNNLITDVYCSTLCPVLARLRAFATNIGRFVRNRRSFWKLGSNLLLNLRQRHNSLNTCVRSNIHAYYNFRT